MATTPVDRILFELFDRIDDSAALTLEEVLATYPEDEAAARSAFSQYQSYQSFRSGLPLLVSAPQGLLVQLPPGTRLGDFEVIDLLAVGGMSSVYRAQQLSLGSRIVALKVMPATGRPQVDRFQREALTLAGLHHPHLAEVYGFGQDLNHLFLAMKLVEGPTLRAVLEELVARKQPLNPQEVRQIVTWVAQVASALREVHERGLVHRDVKPSNIVIQDEHRGPGPTQVGHFRLPTGSAILVDFGLVREARSSIATATGGAAATPGYAPLEQLEGKATTPATDVFSLGATLHDLLSGRLPERRRPAFSGLEPLRELSSVNRDLEAVVRQATKEQANQRYNNASELCQDLDAWLEGHPVAARRLTTIERARRWTWRNPGKTAAAFAAMICLSLIGMGAFALVEIKASANAAQRAFEGGDIVAMRSALSRVPYLLDWAVLDQQLQVAAEAIRDPRGTDLATVLRSLDANDHAGALEAAAEHLRASANRERPHEPLVAGYFVGTLNRLADDLPNEPLPGGIPRADPTVRLAARLMYEVFREEALGPFLPWRRSLRSASLRLLEQFELRERGEFPHMSRHVITALSGCGELTDLSMLVSVFEKGDLEDQRLSLQAMERIVRLANQNENLGGLTYSVCRSLWDAYGHLALERVRDDPPSDREWNLGLEGADALHKALLLAYRQSPSAGHPSFCPEFFEAAGPHPRLHWLTYLAAGADSRFDVLAPELEPGRDALTWRQLGHAIGLRNDRDVLEAVRERARAHGSAEDFEDGVDGGRLEFHGFKPDEALDYETLLGSPGPTESNLGLPSPQVVFVHDPLETLDHYGHAHPSDVAPLAFWSFRGDPVYGGTAEPQEASKASAHTDPQSLKLWSFGESALRLPFTFSTSEKDRPRRLYVFHQLASRAYFPFQGEALVEVSLNGQRIGEIACGRREGEEAPLNLPQDVLKDGVNKITLRLTEETNTTYRLFEVWIQ